MIKEVPMYELHCDRCGKLYLNLDCYTFSDPDELVFDAEENGWMELEEDVIYCPDCYEYDEETDMYRLKLQSDKNEDRPELPDKKQYGEWISISEALPEYDEEVLVCDRVEPDTMWFAHRSDNPDVMRDSHQFCHAMPDLNVTHWMRIKQVNE